MGNRTRSMMGAGSPSPGMRDAVSPAVDGGAWDDSEASRLMRYVVPSRRRACWSQWRKNFASTATMPNEAAPVDSIASRQPLIPARWAPR